MKATTTTNASVSRASGLSAALDDAIASLTVLDADKLETIEGMMSTLLGGPEMLVAGNAQEQGELQEVIARHRLLGTLLASTSLNLDVLERMHRRNTMGDGQWVR